MYATNHVPVIDQKQSMTGCCTLIDPDEWDEKVFTFEGKKFAKTRTKSFMHVPLNMGSVMKRAQALIDEAEAAEDDWLILSQDVSPWYADHYFAVTKDVPGMVSQRLSGTYLTKVFEGPYRDAPKWYRELEEFAHSMGKKPLNTYFFYTTCPNCAKKYGKNYVIGFVQV